MSELKAIDFCSKTDEQSNREVASLWKDDLLELIHGRDEHNALIRVCSPIVTEEDGSDLIPNWARVQNALMRLVTDRDSYRSSLKDILGSFKECGTIDKWHVWIGGDYLIEDAQRIIAEHK